MSQENNITELRSTLFDTLRELKSGNLDIDRAKAINETAQTIINSAKVEVDHMRVTGNTHGSGFIAQSETKPALTSQTPTGSQSIRPVPGGNVITHRLR